MAGRKRSLSNDDADVDTLYKEWDDALCPICMDHPHNAVLLICTSHDKGCRSYICDTSYRHSNCLDRFKKKPGEDNANPNDSGRIENETGLMCPLCRGGVLGWKVLGPARKHLNLKARSCSRDSCSFSGNYVELRRHARRAHPTARPSDVDPSRERNWHRLEDEREYGDVVSAIHSAVPGAVVVGDYMIENGGDGDGSQWLSNFLLFQMIGSGARLRGGGSRASPSRRGPGGGFSSRRSLWGGSLLGFREGQVEGGEVELNIQNDLGHNDGRRDPRRRRRLTRDRPDEDQR